MTVAASPMGTTFYSKEYVRAFERILKDLDWYESQDIHKLRAEDVVSLIGDARIEFRCSLIAQLPKALISTYDSALDRLKERGYGSYPTHSIPVLKDDIMRVL